MSETRKLPLTNAASGRSIRSRIVTLVVLILTPLLILFVWMTLNLANEKRKFIATQRAHIADVVTFRVDRVVARDFGLLTGLAVSNALEQDNFDAFEQQAKSLAGQPGVSRIWAFTRLGKVIVSAGDSAETATLPGFDKDTAEKVFNGERVVSSVHGEGLTKATVTLALPVFRKDKIIIGLAAVIYVQDISRVFSDTGMDPRWAAAIVDRDGRYVARSLNAESWIGKMARPALIVAARSTSTHGVFENVTYEGMSAINSFRRSALTDWTTVVAVPKEMVNAPLVRSMVLLVLAAAAVVLLTISGAFAFAKRISEPVSSLGQLATALAQGRPFTRTRYPLTELNDVVNAFETATAKSAHLAALVASSGDAIISIDLDGNIATWNQAAEDLFGYKAEEVIGRPKAIIVPDTEIENFNRQLAEVRQGHSTRSECDRRKRDGNLIRVSINAAPIRNLAGMIIGMSSILHDVTERNALEESRQLLMRELAHRSKNQLAVVQSIARRTGRTSTTAQDFLERFSRRLQALSTSQDLLMKRNWKSAPLPELTRAIFDSFVDYKRDHVVITGPDISINASAAEAIGLALHELATNSLKYGALSVPAGKVDLSWKEIAEGPDRGDWELKWIESGGPPVEKPVDDGFGSEVVGRVVAMAVNGKAELKFNPTGVEWRLVLPADVLVEP